MMNSRTKRLAYVILADLDEWENIPYKLKQLLLFYPTQPYYWMDLNGNPIKQITFPPSGMKVEYLDKTSDMAGKLSRSNKVAEWVYKFSLHPQNIKRRVLGWIGDYYPYIADEFPITFISQAIDIQIRKVQNQYQKMKDWVQRYIKSKEMI